MFSFSSRVLRAECHHRHDAQWQMVTLPVYLFTACTKPPQTQPEATQPICISLKLKTVISSRLEETHRHVHAPLDHISNRPGLLKTCHPSGIQIMSVITFCSREAVLHIVICSLQCSSFTWIHIRRTLSFSTPVLLQSFRAHVYSILKWLWWIHQWYGTMGMLSSASFSYKVTYNACSCPI